MQRICVIGDTHFARKAEHPILRKHISEGQDSFFDWLADELRSRSINTILMTGDVHDTRISINVESLIKTKRLFQTKMADFDIRIVLGNHDLYYENSYDISSLELFEDIPNVTVYRSKVESIKLLGKQWYIVPWILRENEEMVSNFLKKLSTKTQAQKDSTVILGHFDMFGIDMEGGNLSTFGMDPNLFLNAAKLTLSGHYHGQSTQIKTDNKLLYVGSPYPLTFANANDKHGVWIIDENLDCEFIENKISPTFVDIWDTDCDKELPDLSNSFLRLHISRLLTKEQEFAFRSKIESMRPLFVRTMPYGGTTIEDKSRPNNEREASNLLRMDTVSLSEIYVDTNHETLPILSTGLDPRISIMKKIRDYAETINT